MADSTIDTALFGRLPADDNVDPRLERPLDGMEDSHDDRDVAVACSRRALKIEPACTAALLAIAKHAPTAAERVALLMEIVGIYRRRVDAGALPEIRSIWDRNPNNLVAVLICLGGEISELGDLQGAKACLRYASGLDEDERFGAGRAIAQSAMRPEM